MAGRWSLVTPVANWNQSAALRWAACVVDLMPTAGPPSTPSKPKTNGKPRIVAKHDYYDEASNMLFQVVRYEPKDFRQRQRKPGGGWDWSVKGARTVPYRLPELLAEPTRPIFVVEGEKDADNLARIDVLATCNAGGAGKWTAAHAEFLRGRRVIVLADHDDPGRSHAQQVALTLHGVAAWVRIVDLPGLPPKGDVSDWIAAGGTKDELKRLAEATPNWNPTVVATVAPKSCRSTRREFAGLPNARAAQCAARLGGGGIARDANASGLSRLADPGSLLCDDCPARERGTAPRLA